MVSNRIEAKALRTDQKDVKSQAIQAGNIDETGDKKKGNSTDYVARQYIGNLGKVDNGIVSVNAYGVLGELTFPLMFKVFKLRSCTILNKELPKGQKSERKGVRKV